ncbi:hypothetical protein JCM10449v2_008226 [Rhodotorula kratochvilovae]
MAELTEIELAALPRASVRPDELSRSSSAASLDKLSRTSTLAHLPDLTSTPPSGILHAAGRSGRDSPVAEEVGQRLRRLSMNEGEEDGRELPPVDGGRGAWGFVVAGFILETFIWGFSYSYATILVYFESHDPWQHSSLAALTAIGTILLAIMFICPVFVITVFRRYPEWIKPILWTSAAVNCLSMLAASWASEVWHLILLIGVLGGVSGATLYAPVLLWLNSWWVERRGLASGIVFAGTGVGGTAFPFALSALLERHGFATMCRAWAGITAGVYALALLFLKPRVPLAKPRGVRAPWLTIHDFRFIRDPVVLAMTATSFVSSMGYMPVSLYLPIYTTSLASPGTANLLIASFNLSGSVGSSLTGYASDRSLPLTLSIMGAVGAVLALTAWGLASSLGAVFAFAVLFGAFSQVCSCVSRLPRRALHAYAPMNTRRSTWGAAARDAAGANPHLSTMIFCMFGIVRGVASIVGPFISTGLYEEALAHEERAAWGRFGFRRIIVFVGVMSALSALGGPGIGWARRRKAAQKAATA